jgi:Domain of unknown function (DUF222)
VDKRLLVRVLSGVGPSISGMARDSHLTDRADAVDDSDASRHATATTDAMPPVNETFEASADEPAALVPDEPGATRPSEATASAEGAAVEADASCVVGETTDGSLGGMVAQIRANAVALAAIEATQLRLVAQLGDQVEAEATALLAAAGRVVGAPPDHVVVDSAVDAEVQVVLGIGPGPAARLVDLGRRLTGVLPGVLGALESGRLDPARARVLADATVVLPDVLARVVAEELLAVAGVAPWAGLSPRAWRARIERAVVRVDADAACRRRREAYEARAVRSLPGIAGMAELCDC